MRQQHLRWIGAGLALAVAACGGQSERPSPRPGGSTVLEVRNDATLDMTIFVYSQGGSRDRLGIASAHLTTSFTIPQRLIFGLTALRFQADPIGTGAQPLTREITIEPGDTVVLHIPPGGGAPAIMVAAASIVRY